MRLIRRVQVLTGTACIRGAAIAGFVHVETVVRASLEAIDGAADAHASFVLGQGELSPSG